MDGRCDWNKNVNVMPSRLCKCFGCFECANSTKLTNGSRWFWIFFNSLHQGIYAMWNSAYVLPHDTETGFESIGIDGGWLLLRLRSACHWSHWRIYICQWKRTCRCWGSTCAVLNWLGLITSTRSRFIIRDRRIIIIIIIHYQMPGWWRFTLAGADEPLQDGDSLGNVMRTPGLLGTIN